jgi:hypothetical protein
MGSPRTTIGDDECRVSLTIGQPFRLPGELPENRYPGQISRFTGDARVRVGGLRPPPEWSDDNPPPEWSDDNDKGRREGAPCSFLRLCVVIPPMAG